MYHNVEGRTGNDDNVVRSVGVHLVIALIVIALCHCQCGTINYHPFGWSGFRTGWMMMVHTKSNQSVGRLCFWPGIHWKAVHGTAVVFRKRCFSRSWVKKNRTTDSPIAPI